MFHEFCLRLPWHLLNNTNIVLGRFLMNTSKIFHFLPEKRHAVQWARQTLELITIFSYNVLGRSRLRYSINFLTKILYFLMFYLPKIKIFSWSVASFLFSLSLSTCLKYYSDVSRAAHNVSLRPFINVKLLFKEQIELVAETVLRSMRGRRSNDILE